MLQQICILTKFYWQMTTAISIEDVRREVKILKALSGHRHLVKFHDACEDANNVYIVMEYVSFFPYSFLHTLFCSIISSCLVISFIYLFIYYFLTS